MSDEATEEKKGKKKKEKKPKKEKPPKEKKPKKEKPKKEKKPKNAEGAEGAEGEEGAKKKGPPLLLILIPVFVVLIVAVIVVVFIVLPRLRGKPAEDIDPDDPEAALSAQVENTERAKQGDPRDGEPEATPESESEPEPGSDDTPAPDNLDEEPPVDEPPEEKSVDIVVSMTTSESIDYFRSLPPEALGLPGESMDDYDIFASEHLIMVDDVPCKEFHVYSISGRTGTNNVEGLYLLTQRGARKIYKLDEATNTVTELNWTPPRPEPEPEPEADAETPDEGEAEVETEP